MRGIFLTNTAVRAYQDWGEGLLKSVVRTLDGSVSHSNETAMEKLSGVNYLLPAICKGIPETHHNLCLIMGYLKLERMPNV